MEKIFCYGTLKSDGPAHDLMGNSKFLGEATTSPFYQLYDFGAFPGVTKGSEDGLGVIGEVYECDEKVVKRLDVYECVKDKLFTRTEIELNDGSVVQAYLFARSQGDPKRRIHSGVWDNKN